LLPINAFQHVLLITNVSIRDRDCSPKLVSSVISVNRWKGGH